MWWGELKPFLFQQYIVISFCLLLNSCTGQLFSLLMWSEAVSPLLGLSLENTTLLPFLPTGMIRHHSQIYQRYKQLHGLRRPARKAFSEEFLASERRIVSIDFPHSKRCEYTAALMLHLFRTFGSLLQQYSE